MNTQKLMDTARAMVAGDKGLLAMDESTPTDRYGRSKLVGRLNITWLNDESLKENS